jgi:ssRNA-specific RNase YbeY (16S rRNA maturation enzyme)
VEHELLLYTCHGLLHVLGFNDHTPAQTGLMRKKESQYVH